MKQRPLFAAAVLLLLTAPMSACGGGNDSGIDSDTQTGADSAVRSAITRAVTTNDPSNCVELSTDAFIDDLYKGSIEKCKRETKREKPAKSVRITDLRVEGDTARVRIAPSGGTNGGQVLSVVLAKSGDAWKVNEVRYFYGSDAKTDAKIDTLLSSFRREGLREGFGTQITRCAQARLRVAFRAGGTSFGARELKQEVKAITFGCLRDHPSAAPVVLDAYFEGLRQAARKKLGPAITDCVIERLRQTITPEEIVDALTGSEPPSLTRKESEAGAKCGNTEAILKALEEKGVS